MRRLVLMLSVALSFVAMGATNYFTEGTVWYTLMHPDYNGDGDTGHHHVMVKTWLERVPECWNLDVEDNVLIICQTTVNENGEEINGKKSIPGMVKVEEDVVYYRRHPLIDNWEVMYDFFLDKGDNVEVCHIPVIWPNTYDAILYKEHCIERGAVEGYPELEMITVEETSPDGEKGTGEWIAGIGSTKGLIHNCMYARMLGGGSSQLVKVEHNGKTIYEASPHCGVTELPAADAPSGKKYSLGGLEISEPADGELYISDGQLRCRR